MFSSLVTATKNKYATLRGGDEADGDVEDDSHISRVLRNYYTEQGRPFPPWLGGGPQQQGRPGQQAQSGLSLRRGNNNTGPQPGVKTTLSDIWDAPPQNQQPSSGPGSQQGQGQNTAGMNKMRFFRRDQQAPPSQQQPSQYHGPHDQPHQPTPAQSSIRDRLWSNRNNAGGRTPSPQQASPVNPQYGNQSYGGRDRSPAPPPQQQYHAYPGNGHSKGGNDKPVMSATISFGQDDCELGGYGAPEASYAASSASSGSGYRRGPPLQGGKVGLPSGPRMMRQGGGGYDR
ncbi:Sec1-binding region of Mso1-domain-containing protein [Kalaharituber pfeilii]|nr:Sec1-binding region of Mso1-domain-containing protein [Kalaharituber pfeilii]